MSDQPDPKPCERCGERDCPTLGWLSDKQAEMMQTGNVGDYLLVRWIAAFHACAAMRGAKAAERQSDMLDDISTSLRRGIA